MASIYFTLQFIEKIRINMINNVLKLAFILIISVFVANSAVANDQYLLDGTSMTFFYQTGRGVDMQIDDDLRMD